MNLLARPDAVEYFAGAAGIDTEADAFFPRRHTPRQLEYIASVDDSWRIRTQCPAGISLLVSTHGSTVSVRFESLEFARRYAGFDLYVDGVLREHKGNDDAGVQTASFSLDSCDNDVGRCKTIQLYLPHVRRIRLLSIDLKDASPIEARGAPYLALGDSITQGMDASFPSKSYPVQLSRSLSLDLLNQAIGGHRFDPQFVQRLDPAPKLITVAYGTNDWRHYSSIRAFRIAVAGFLDTLASTFPDAPIVVVTPLWRALENGLQQTGFSLEAVRGVIEEEAHRLRLDHISGTELLPRKNELYRDGTHPTDDGHVLLAQNLAEAVKRRLHT